MSLGALTIAEARDALRAGDLTAVELTSDMPRRRSRGPTALNAFVHPTPEIALAQAKAADARLAAGRRARALRHPAGHQGPVLHARACPARPARCILEGFRPEYESTVTRKLFEAGAVMLGKLNMDEFAMGSSNETSTYGDGGQPVAARQRRHGR